MYRIEYQHIFFVLVLFWFYSCSSGLTRDHILQGCLSDTGAIMWMPSVKWLILKDMGKSCFTTINHNKVKPVCILLRMHCIIFSRTSVKIRKRYSPVYKLFLSFMVISDVCKYFILKILHLLSSPGALKSTKAVPGKIHGSGGHNTRNYKQDRANFHRFRAWQIVVIFTRCRFWPSGIVACVCVCVCVCPCVSVNTELVCSITHNLWR